MLTAAHAGSCTASPAGSLQRAIRRSNGAPRRLSVTSPSELGVVSVARHRFCAQECSVFQGILSKRSRGTPSATARSPSVSTRRSNSKPRSSEGGCV